jgi:hypothetical protein
MLPLYVLFSMEKLPVSKIVYVSLYADPFMYVGTSVSPKYNLLSL